MKKAKGIDRHTLVRIYQIDKMIRDGKYPNCSSLAEHFELSPRTIARDIEAMKDQLNAEILYDPKENGYYYAKENKFSLPALKFSEGELFSVFLIEKLLPYFDDQMKNTFMNVINKVKVLAKDTTTIESANIAEMFSIDFGILKEAKSEIYMALMNALKNKHTVSINYYSSYQKKESKRSFDPYHIRYSKSSWYVIGYCHLNKRVQIFSIANIKQVTTTNKTYQIPANFSIDDFFGDAWRLIKGKPQDIKLKFSQQISQWVGEKIWHKSQKITTNKDGSIIMELHVDGLNEILDWILGFGSKVEVISPKELRVMVKKEGQGIVKNNE